MFFTMVDFLKKPYLYKYKVYRELCFALFDTNVPQKSELDGCEESVSKPVILQSTQKCTGGQGLK